jgi:hypothetical protein
MPNDDDDDDELVNDITFNSSTGFEVFTEVPMKSSQSSGI